MFWILLKLISSLFAAIFCGIVVREVGNYFLLNRYKKQGIYTIYNPFFGFYKWLVLGTGHKTDICTFFKKFLAEHKDEPLIALNSDKHFFTNAIIINSPEAYKDFLKKESCMIKVPQLNFKYLGFFFDHGEKAMKSRAIFSKIFRNENVKLLCGPMTTINGRHISYLKSK